MVGMSRCQNGGGVKTFNIMECAEFLKIERNFALTLAGNGTLPGAKIGRAWVFLEEDVVEYLRAETRKQMRVRQVIAPVEEALAASVARNAPTPVSPRALAKRSRMPKRFDLSGYNQDGTPKLLKDL